MAASGIAEDLSKVDTMLDDLILEIDQIGEVSCGNRTVETFVYTKSSRNWIEK